MKEIILSIKPIYSNKIYEGKKTIELRKQVGKMFMPDSKIYIYTSSPVKSITGSAIIEKIDVLKVDVIRKMHIQKACISLNDFNDYFGENEYGVMIWLKNVIKYRKDIKLSELRDSGLSPPQSYRYVTNNIISSICKRGV